MIGVNLCVLIAFFASFQCISALKCYNCSSMYDPDNCGVTFGYDHDSEKAKAITIDCPGNFTACRKIVHSDVHKAKTIVERNCWSFNNNGTVESDFYKCEDYSFGTVCYCNAKDDAKIPCNGQIRVALTLGALLLGLLPLAMCL